VRVAVLGSRTANSLFGNANPVGRSIKINGVIFEVIGVLAEKAVRPRLGGSIVIVPLETAYTKLLGSRSVNDGRRLLTDINISANDPEDVDGLMVQAERVLRRQHGLSLHEEVDFLCSARSRSRSVQYDLSTFTAFLAALPGFRWWWAASAS
jgi:hypothetical protein